MLTPEYLEELQETGKLAELIRRIQIAAEANAQEMARLIGGGMDLLDVLADEKARKGYIDEYSLPSINWRNYVATSINHNQQSVINRVAEINKMAPDLVEEIFNEAGALSYAYDRQRFKEAFEAGIITDLPPGTLADNPQMQKVFEGILKQAQGDIKNLTKTTAVNSRNNLYNAYSQAYTNVATGGFTTEQAVKQAVHWLADKGVFTATYKYTDKNGKPRRREMALDASVRLNIVTSMNRLSKELTDDMCERWECPAVETSAHIGARDTGTGYENHESWQGRVFSLKGRAPEYPDFDESCGHDDPLGFGGYNCRHGKSPFFPGISERAWNPDDYKNPTVTYSGKEMSLYEASQIQRSLEREIRKWKQEEDICKQAGVDHTDAKSKREAAQKRVVSLCNQTGLRRKPNRERLIVKKKAA